MQSFKFTRDLLPNILNLSKTYPQSFYIYQDQPAKFLI